MSRLLSSPAYFIVLGLLCGIVGFRIGWHSRQRVLQPLFQGILGFVAFAASWRIHGPVFAALAVAGWALGTSLVSIVVFQREAERVDRQILRAAAYREEMFEWLRTGRGPEMRPLRTILIHLRELVLYSIAAVLTANFLSIVMGAVLLNYMNAYVARLLTLARKKGTVALLGWNHWSVIRVAAYIVLGSVAAAPLAAVAGYPADPTVLRPMLILAAVGVVLDALLKLTLSRRVGRLLAEAIDLDH